MRDSGSTGNASELRVSVIVPVFNAARTLARCLERLSRMDFPAAGREIVLVDNGSSDESPALCRQFAQRTAGVRLVQCVQPGPAAARNAGARAAAGRWLAFTDSDCFVQRAWLTWLIRGAERAEAAANGRWTAVGGRIGVWGARRAALFSWYERRRFLNQEKFLREPRPGFRPFFATANLAVRRVVFERLGGFDSALLAGEDADLCWRLQDAGGLLAWEPRAVVWHRFSGRPADLFSAAAKYGAGVRQLQQKYPGRFPPLVRLEPERWGWLLKAAVKAPVARVIRAGDPMRRHDAWFDLLSNAGYLWGRWCSAPRRR
ncbi:MAG: hypothetical protein Kow0059_11040 [Candidatus Sumerlaeia bacterium]